MKFLNKTLTASTFFVALFVSQATLAGDEGTHGEYSGHPAPSYNVEPSQDVKTMQK